MHKIPFISLVILDLVIDLDYFYKMPFRDLLDQYAACGSSREVVEVQEKWLQECEKEQEQRASQGILTWIL